MNPVTAQRLQGDFAVRRVHFIAFCCGLGSMLFVPTPFGRIAMFDLAAFAVVPFLLREVRKWGKPHRTLLGLSLLWLVSAVATEMVLGDVPFVISLKGCMIIFNVFCMLVFGFAMITRSRYAMAWFLVGSGISDVLSLYVFQNGALLSIAQQAGGGFGGNISGFLQERQVYPMYIWGFIFACLLPLARKSIMPPFMVGICFLLVGILLLLVGSRSAFGVYAVSGVVTLVYVFDRNGLRRLFQNTFLVVILGGILGWGIFKAYEISAVRGWMGEGERAKYELQIVESGVGAFGGRSDALYCIPFLIEHPIFGAGVFPIDRWGIVARVRDKHNWPDPPDEREKFIPGHSVFFGAWSQNGIGGGVFWLYALYLLLQFARKALIQTAELFPIYFFCVASTFWAVLTAPFGGMRGYCCLLLCLCVVAVDDLRHWPRTSEGSAGRPVHPGQWARPT